MKEIVVVSGKGGTGKTSITAALSYLGNKDIVLADCDVDAADMHLLMQPDFGRPTDFYSGELAEIDQEICTQCGACADVCRFDAIPIIDTQYTIDPLNCEGCGYCPRVCPENAISMHEQNVGQCYVSKIKTGATMVHARLGIGADNSGKLVAYVKNEAKRIAESENRKYVLVDGSPGIGCPVVSSLSGANFVVLVTEPTVSGLHDLKRVFQLVKKFKIPAGCIINKADLNETVRMEIERFLQEENIAAITSLPYDGKFTEAIVQGKTIPELGENNLTEKIETAWQKITAIVE